MLCYGNTMLLFETPICYGMKFKCYALLYVVKKNILEQTGHR